MKKRVLIITYYWPPSGGAGVQRWLKFSKYLREFGWEPIVLTVDPEKASYPVRDETLCEEVGENVKVYTTDTFEPYGLYKKISKNEEIPYSGFANESKTSLIQEIARFVRGNFFIPDARKGWNRYALAKAREIIEQERITTLITTSPPHSTQLIGLKLKNEFKLNWMADLRDPWTDIYYYKQMNHTVWAKKADAKMERMVLEKADNVVVVSKAIKKMFASRSDGIDEHKIHIIPNGYDESDFDEKSTSENEEFVIAYTGTLSDVYDGSAFIKALEQVDTPVKLQLVGRISEDVLKKFEHSSIQVIGHVEHSKSIDYLLNADALLLIIPKIDRNEGILTGKLFEYLAVRKPIIAIGPPNGDAAEIINECDSGRMFDHADSNGVFDFISTLLLSKTKGIRPEVGNKNVAAYSRKQLTQQLVRILSK